MIHTLESGKKGRLMGMEFTHGVMGISMRENGKNA
jgi:hypothetical protein